MVTMSARDILSLFAVRWLLPTLGVAFIVFLVIQIVQALSD
jgi:hypothetical protein